MGDAPTPRQRLNGLMRGYIDAQVVYAVAKLGIPDLLAGEARTASDLATATQTNPDALRRLLAAAAALGIVNDLGGDRFDATELSETLCSDTADGLRNAAIMHGEEHYRSFADLLGTVRDGEPAFPRIYGEPFFDYLARAPGPSATFNAAMTDFTRSLAAEVAATGAFAHDGTVVDVGGGAGTLLAGLLRTHPEMRGVLFDLPAGVEGARALLERDGVSERCEIRTGSFFDEVPSGDALVLKNIVHDWDDASATLILTRCREALPPHGRVVLIERVMPERVTPDDGAGALLDVVMLVMLTGRERTEDGFRALLGDAGLALASITPLASGPSMIEARPA